MAISQIVDDQLKQIRKERAELDELRASLERRQEELQLREQTQSDDASSAGDRKDSLLKEIADLTAEVKRLRTERDASIESFGGEISKVHAEKSAESAAQVKHLQTEINFLIKGKTELEEESARLREQIESMDEKAKHDLDRIIEEKENAVKRARDEREASLKEINLAHSVAVADLERAKKELENEIAALEQTKKIEWNKIQAEISRYKTAQLAELDASREQFLSDHEKEKENLQNALRAKERKQISAISADKRAWEKEILVYQTEKQKILDEIKLAEYEFEKTKAQILANTEKTRVDEEKKFEAMRAEEFVKIEEESALRTANFKKEAAEEKKRLRAEINASEKEVLALEAKKAEVLAEINALEARFEQHKTENEAALESIRLDGLKEIDEKRIEKLREIEELRTERIDALETAFLTRSGELEAARAEKLEECRRAIQAAEAELTAMQKAQISTEKHVSVLRAETIKIQQENEALKKAAIVEKQLELEKMANEKLAEVETICSSRVAAATALARQIEADGNARDEKLSADIAASTEALLELRRMVTAQNLELQQQRDTKLEEIEQARLEAFDEFSKIKLQKFKATEAELEAYKKERLQAIQEDIERQSKTHYKQLDELAALNADYNKRARELQELALSVEADMRLIEFKNKQIDMLQTRNKEVEGYLAKADADAAETEE